jgi:hypothetical protein
MVFLAIAAKDGGRLDSKAAKLALYPGLLRPELKIAQAIIAASSSPRR